MKTAISALCLVSLFFLLGFNWPYRMDQQPGPELPLPTFAVYNFSFKANAPNGLLKTGIAVNKFDFVCFVVNNRIKLGSTVPYSDASGVVAPHLVVFNHLKDPVNSRTHGRLFCGNVDEWVPTTGLNSMRFCTALKSNWCGAGDIDFDTIRANAFVAKDKMNLVFLLNDLQPQNNSGAFTIEVIIVPYLLHKSRNKYNRCPSREPKETGKVLNDCLFNTYEAKDSKNLMWETTENEIMFHGILNNSYRGDSPELLGCQCVYSKLKGELVYDKEHVGTFDFALAKRQQSDLFSKDLTSWKHIVLDVWTHIAFNEFAKSTGRTFEYDLIPYENIYGDYP